jgi:hypothetical protein
MKTKLQIYVNGVLEFEVKLPKGTEQRIEGLSILLASADLGISPGDPILQKLSRTSGKSGNPDMSQVLKPGDEVVVKVLPDVHG